LPTEQNDGIEASILSA